MELPDTITEDWLKANLTYLETITFSNGANSERCLNCGSVAEYHSSEPWTSSYICGSCGILMFIVRADRMGGSCEEPVSLYRLK